MKMQTRVKLKKKSTNRIAHLEETTIRAMVSPKSQRRRTDPMMTGRVKNPPCPPPPFDDTDPRKQSWVQKI